MKVLKFGGSSLADYDSMLKAANIVKSRCKAGDVVVVSAMGGITNKLIAAGNEAYEGRDFSEMLNIIKEQHYEIIKKAQLSPSIISNEIETLEKSLENRSEYFLRWLDEIQSFGEMASSRIFAAFLKKVVGVDAESFFPKDIGYYVDGEHGNADPNDYASENQIKTKLGNYDKVAVVTGYIGIGLEGTIYTTGRGGSDLTATSIGNYLDAERIELWSDVNGIMTANPKIVSSAKTIKKLCYDEAEQLAVHGAKLHPRSIKPAKEKKIPIFVMNTFDPQGSFTIIDSEACETDSILKGITMDYKKNDILVHVRTEKMYGGKGFLESIGKAVAYVNVGLVASSENSLDFTVSEDEKGMLENAIQQLEIEKGFDVEICEGRKAIYAVGIGMRGTPGISGRLFNSLGKKGINIEAIAQGNEINIGFVVKAEDSEDAVRCIHNEFFGY